MTVPPTEHIDVPRELAAAVELSWLMHLLHLFPLVSLDVIPKTVGIYCCCSRTPYTSYIDKLGVYCTHAIAFHFCVTEW